MQKKKRIWPFIVGVIVILLVVGFLLLRGWLARANATTYIMQTVKKGNIVSSISGTGILKNEGTAHITGVSGIKVNRVNVSLGDEVKTGDIIATVDLQSVKDAHAALITNIASLDADIARSSSDGMETVYSMTSGRVKRILCAAGDEVVTAIANNGSLIVISTDEKMKIEIQSTELINLNTEVTVKLANEKQYDGTVLSRTATGYVVTITDNGPVYGDNAEVYIEDKMIGSGTLDINAPMYAVAGGGTVKSVSVKENAKVSRGTKLLTLKDVPFSASYQTKMQTRIEAVEKLNILSAALLSPCIYAEADGIISELFISDDTMMGVTADYSDFTVATINVGGITKMEIDIDEQDVSKIFIGQDAVIKVGAVSGATYPAKISNISKIGSGQGGVTTYTVGLRLQGDDKLQYAMNATATIVLGSRNDVLIIPLDAVMEDNEGEFVFVGTQSDGSDIKQVRIKTGLSDGSNVEVTEGLNEGDTVMYVDNTVSGLFGGMMMPMGNRVRVSDGGESGPTTVREGEPRN